MTINGGTVKGAVKMYYLSMDEVRKSIFHHSAVAGALALIPVPGASVIGMFAVEMDMCRRINELVGVKFSENKLKCILKYMASNLIVNVGTIVAFEALKFIPGINIVAGIGECLSLAVACYAVGWLYMKMLGRIIESGKDIDSLSEQHLKDIAFSIHMTEGTKIMEDAKSTMKNTDFSQYKKAAENFAKE